MSIGLAVYSVAAIAITVRFGLLRMPSEAGGRLPRDPAMGALLMMGFVLASGIGASVGEGIAPAIGVNDDAYRRMLRGVAANLLQLMVVAVAVRSPLFNAATRGAAGLRRAILEGVVGFAVAVPVVSTISIVFQWLLPLLGLPRAPETAHETLALIATRGDALLSTLTFAQVVVLVPLAEEAGWRGLLQPSLRRAGMKPLWAVLATAALFTSIHWTVIAPEGRATGLAMLMVLGVALGILRERTGGITASVLLHALFNALNVAITVMKNPVSSTP